MAAMSDARNVLFITADQWRGDCLSSEKHPLVRTPHLDALASQGVRFRRHFAQAAPCGPSRASLHTGMYLQNHRSGTNGTPLDARHTNWALEARRLGYDPVLFGYTDTSQDPRTLDPDDERLRSYEGLLPGIRPVVEMTTYPHAWAEWLRALPARRAAPGETLHCPELRPKSESRCDRRYRLRASSGFDPSSGPHRRRRRSCAQREPRSVGPAQPPRGRNDS